MTENALQRPASIDMQLKDGPFKRLHGRWQFLALSDAACKVSLELEFEPASRLLGPALKDFVNQVASFAVPLQLIVQKVSDQPRIFL